MSSSTSLDIPTARVFKPLLAPGRYKGAYGGRGSGKSQFFAGLGIEQCFRKPGTRGLCVREVQKSLEQSAKKLLEDKIVEYGLSEHFEPLKTHINTPGGGVIAFTGMQDHTADSVKSYEAFDWAWVEEAQSLSQHSLTLLRPTIRKPGSELWFSWNPRRRQDPVDALLRGPTPPTGSIVVRANWNQNPWFPKELETERSDDERDRPDQYDHIWEGDYVKVTEGAYFAKSLSQARREGRIGRVAADPLMQIRAFWDIGGSGKRADHTAIWIAQFVGREIRVLDHYEAQGQPLATHVDWLRNAGYGRALCVLPHDGAQMGPIVAGSFAQHLMQAEFQTQVVPNQGTGAAMRRVESVRRRFPRIWINEETCSAGIEALGAYHERKDEVRLVGLGPEHDWASHSSDAFGLMCIAYDAPSANDDDDYPDYADDGRSSAGY